MRASSQRKVWLAVAGLAVVLGGTGCSNQQEGEWCSKLNNNNDDCSAGLACVDRNGTTLCCPEPPAQPSVPQCVEQAPGARPTSEAGVEAGAQTETDASDASEPDASADTAAVVETSTDAAQTVGEAAAIDAPADAQSSTDVSVEASSDVSSGTQADASTGDAQGASDGG